MSINRSDVSIVKFDKVKLKCNEQERLKWELNRLRMKVYRDSRMSEAQKEKVRLYDKQSAAAHRLKQKMNSDEQREKWRKEKSKSRQKKGNKCRIPDKSEQFEKLVNDICYVAKTSPKKANILV